MRHLALLLLLGVPAVHAQAVPEQASAWDTLSHCVSTTKPSTPGQVEYPKPDTNGLDVLEQHCPGLRDALHQLGYDELLGTEVERMFTAEKLADLEKIAQRYREVQPSEIDVAPLAAVLEEIGAETDQSPPTAWERFRTWLRDLLGRKAESDKNSWLDPWLDKMEVSGKVREAIFWTMVVIVIALALWVVGNELRAAGILRRRRPAHSGAAPGAIRVDAKPASIDDLEAVPLHERPSLLLRALIVTLTKSGRLTSAKAMTHRELASRAVFEGEGQRDSFQRVAGLAERVLYGSGMLPQEEIERIVQEGRSLDASLRGTAT